jgi:hypothetical protein
MSNEDLKAQQRAICIKYGAEFFSSPPDLKVGIASNVRGGILPINGMRHPPAGDTTGWYIWAGEVLSENPEFFKASHVAHLSEWRPVVLKYLGLAPGWRFLVASSYQDVWRDQSLLDA